MIVGLHSGTGSKLVVLGGVLSIAIADSFSDALGIHISEESDRGKAEKEVWAATLATFLSKIAFSSTFIIPILLLSLETAMLVSVAWGLLVLGVLSYHIAKSQSVKPIRVIAEHLLIAVVVIIITHFVGEWVAVRFG
jgi:VIT1/CCC1 family predicted Fe2+/Mn2+ transporter